MPWAAAFMLVGMTFVMFLPIILEQVEGIVRAWKGAPREKVAKPEPAKAPYVPPPVQDICHNRSCPGYGTSLAHKCHDLDCTMHGKKVSA